jgi:hypothetical protein
MTQKSCPAYDEGDWLFNTLYNNGTYNLPNFQLSRLFWDAMWVGYTMANEGTNWMNSDATVKFRIAKPYSRYYSVKGDTLPNAENNGFPVYQFKLDDLAPTVNSEFQKNLVLDQIGVVPNPYYWFSGYEESIYDRTVKFINLPKECTISIYTMNGKLINQFKKNDELSFYDWDITNSSGNKIRSGIYLIHVNAPGLGEKILKWFCTTDKMTINDF